MVATNSRYSHFILPCEPTLRDRLPKGVGWLYEVKLDGYRMQVHKAGPAITLYTRNGADWTNRFPHLAAAPTSLPCKSAIIDAGLVHTDVRAGVAGLDGRPKTARNIVANSVEGHRR